MSPSHPIGSGKARASVVYWSNQISSECVIERQWSLNNLVPPDRWEDKEISSVDREKCYNPILWRSSLKGNHNTVICLGCHNGFDRMTGTWKTQGWLIRRISCWSKDYGKTMNSCPACWSYNRAQCSKLGPSLGLTGMLMCFSLLDRSLQIRIERMSWCGSGFRIMWF